MQNQVTKDFNFDSLIIYNNSLRVNAESFCAFIMLHGIKMCEERAARGPAPN